MLSAPVRAYTLFAVCVLVAGAGCAGTKGKPGVSGDGGHAGSTISGIGGGIFINDGGFQPFEAGSIMRPDGADQACGDKIVEPEFAETCDDGNKLPDDGCDPLC